MCGRYTIFTDAAALAARFHAYVPPSLLAPSYNAAPSQGLPTILRIWSKTSSRFHVNSGTAR
jgi:putative SOS response-associated peptidase YedK